MLKQTLLLSIIVMMSISTVIKAEEAEEAQEYFAPFFAIGGGVDLMLTEEVTLFSIEPSVGFFVDDEFLVGVNMGYTRFAYEYDDLEATLWTFGPFFRKYLYSFENYRLRIFMQGKLGIETGKAFYETPFGYYNETIGPNLNLTLFEPGVSFQVLNWLAVDLAFNVGVYYYMTSIGSEKLHNFGVGSNLNPMLDIEIINLQRRLLSGKVYLYF
jgi:hypothetical protein